MDNVASKVSGVFERMAQDNPDFAEILAPLMRREASWRYYAAHRIGIQRLFEKKGNRLYCFTTEKVAGKYMSYALVCQKKGGPAVPKHVRSHAKRKDAKARALAMVQVADPTGRFAAVDQH